MTKGKETNHSKTDKQYLFKIIISSKTHSALQ